MKIGFKLTGLAIGAAMMVTAIPVNAQEAEKRDATYHRIVLVDFKPGKMAAAQKIVNDYFRKASINAGTPMPVQHMMMTGPWDVMLVWKMDGGMSETEWSTTPNGAKWMAAMAELTGSQDAAMKKWREYQSHIAKSTSAFSYVSK